MSHDNAVSRALEESFCPPCLLPPFPTRRTKEEVGRQHQGMDRPGVRQVPEGSGEHGKMEKTGCKIICGAPTTLAVKGLMMMMMKRVLKR